MLWCFVVLVEGCMPVISKADCYPNTRKTPPFRAGMDSAGGEAALFNGASAAVRCTGGWFQ